jgi:chemotaxis signal transduction protein
MTGSASALEARLKELRESFDRSFREPVAVEREPALELLAIRIGREPFALRLAEIGALEAGRIVTSVPSRHPELLGIAGLRGAVVAVFDLASLLELPRAEAPRWLVLAKGAPLAFAFGVFEGQLSVRPDAVARTVDDAGRKREIIQSDGAGRERLARPLLDISGLALALQRRMAAKG